MPHHRRSFALLALAAALLALAAALDITVEVLADATIGAPRDITPAIEVGAVECG